MFVAYCKTDLPERVVIGWSDTLLGVTGIAHTHQSEDGEPETPGETSVFELNDEEWALVSAPDVGETKKNIEDIFKERFT